MDIHTRHGTTGPRAEEEKLRLEAAENLGQQLFTLFANNPNYYEANELNGRLQAFLPLNPHIPDDVRTAATHALASSVKMLEERLHSEQAGLSISVTTLKSNRQHSIVLSFNDLHADGPEQVKALTTKATAYFYTHRDAIVQGIHDAIFRDKTAPAITNIAEELRNAPGTARTLVAVPASRKPTIAQTLEEQRQKNHVEKLAYPLLELFLGKATYNIAETNDGDKLIATVRVNPGIPNAELGSAMQALYESLGELKKRKAEGFVPRIVAAPQSDGGYNVTLIFDDLDQITQKETARRYLEKNKTEIAQGIRTSIFGEQTTRYLQ